MARVKVRGYDYCCVEQIRLWYKSGHLHFFFSRFSSFSAKSISLMPVGETRQRCDTPGASLGLQPEAT